MKQFLQRALFSVIAAALITFALWLPAGAGAAGSGSHLSLQNASLSCSDGTLLQLALSTSELNALTSAVTAINLYPAGNPALACSVSQSAGLSASSGLADSSSGNPNIDYAVGGGRATLFGCVDDQTLVPEETNFALNARVAATANGTAGSGTFNVTIPQSQANCPDTRGGHFNGKIDCVLVGGNGPGSAQATFTITHSAGGFSGSDGVELRVDVLDTGLPGGTGDLIRIRVPQNGPCDFAGYSATRPVDNGNISVHQVS